MNNPPLTAEKLAWFFNFTDSWGRVIAKKIAPEYAIVAIKQGDEGYNISCVDCDVEEDDFNNIVIPKKALQDLIDILQQVKEE